MKKNKNNKNIFSKIISILLIIVSLFFVGLIFYIDLLPTKFSVLILSAILIFNLFSVVLVNIKKLKRKVKRVIYVFMAIAILLTSIISIYLCRTLGVLLNNGDSKYKLEHYSVLVLKNSDYDKLNDIKNEDVGYFKNSTGSKEANDKLSDEVNVSFSPYDTADNLVQELLDSKINVIIIEDSIKSLMEEEITDFKALTKVIYKFTIKVNVESTLIDVDVTEEPFAIYISGIDTYGEIASVSRSDVNMLMVVNPKINQILLVSIPRDYYVQLHGTTGTKDKLTHAGIYGIDMSIQTIEDLLELKINYYLKVNFTSVIDIVDALGGLDIYSEYTFTSYSGYKFKKGMNSVDGKQALDFARTRKAFKDGDRQRGKNQQAVIEAVIRKVSDKTIITKYNSLLDAVDGKYQTNMNLKKITSLVKMQLKDMPSWNITSYSLEGTDAKDYTYTYNQLLYVMKPDEESVRGAIEIIDSILNDEKLESSYENIGGTSNKVTQTPITSNNNEEKKETNINSSVKINKYKINFDSTGGSKIDSQTIEENKTIKKPNSPIKEGYEFIGWYFNNLEYDFSTKVTKDITLVAKWEKKISQEDDTMIDTEIPEITPQPEVGEDEKSTEDLPDNLLNPDLN